MNHTVNYLTFCVNQEVIVFSEFFAISSNDEKIKIEKNHKIRLLSFSYDDSEIKINFSHKNQIYNSSLPWNSEIPFTHFKTAEDAYKHSKFTKMGLGKDLEDYIFARSPKYATKYAIEVTKKRLSSFLEKKIFRNYKYLLFYAYEFDITLTEKEEQVFLKDKTGKYVAMYGYNKIKGKLPESLHNYMIMIAANSKNKNYYMQKYFESLKHNNYNSFDAPY